MAYILKDRSRGNYTFGEKSTLLNRSIKYLEINNNANSY